MTLLRQIQDDAVSNDVGLATVLRRCKVLASRLDSKLLEEWIRWESDGYPRDVVLPKYRTVRGRVLGHFSGPFGSELRNAEIPSSCIPEELRKPCTTYEVHESIQAIEGLNEAEKGRLQVPIPPEVVRAFHNSVYEGQNCIQAWMIVPSTACVEILNKVRNKVLDFALRVEQLAPAAGEAAPGEPALPGSVVTQVFHTTVFGTANVLGKGSQLILASHDLVAGDAKALRKLLVDAGLETADVSDLLRALDKEPKPKEPGRFGNSVATWLGTMVGNAANGIWKVSVAVASDLLTNAINAYYGLG